MMNDWLLRLRSLFRSTSVEQDLDDELRFHFDELVELHTRRGLAPDEAARQARLDLGGFDQIKEEHRDARGTRTAEDLARDLRYALRQLRRSPGFAVLAVVCLGLGIGVSTAIFSVVNAVLMRPMPVADPHRLLKISRGAGGSLPYSAYRELEGRSHTLAGLAATLPMESDIDVDGDSDFAVAEVVSANYAAVMGIAPSVGRWVAHDHEAAAVISDAIWERKFGRRPDIVGRLIRSESQTYTIVGVAPREFAGVFGPMRTDLWVPVGTRPQLAALLDDPRGSQMLMLFGRLRADATAAQATAELNGFDAQLGRDRGDSPAPIAPIVAEPVRGIASAGRPMIRRLMTLMAGVVAVLLLIVAVNVGSLLMVRGALREREFVVRRGLGASRSRLLQQLLMESLVLALGGAVAGVILALWTAGLLEQSFPTLVGAHAAQLDLSLDRRALAFATIISLLTTVLCGLQPAWRTARVRGVTFKQEIGSGPPRRRPLALIAQVAMSLVLLFVAGGFVQALLTLQATDPGFEVAGTLYAYTAVPSPPATPESRRELYGEALERLRGLPGVRTAALTFIPPLIPSGSSCVALPDGARLRLTSSAVDIGYFDTLGIELLAGRDFAAVDFAQDRAAAVIVNESLARRLWPDQAAVGQRVLAGCDKAQPAIVIGVVSDSAIRSVAEPPAPHLYRQFTAQNAGLTTILVAATTDPAALVQPVRRSLLDLGGGIRVYAVEPLSAHVEQSFAQVRWLTGVLAGLGVLALVLAAVGVYGTIAYRVTLRTQEIGVRMALGARRADVFRDVVRYGLAIVVIGVAIGEVVSAGMTGLVGSVVEGIGPAGFSVHVAVAAIWIAVALAACYLPAARAARVDPVVALRQE